MRLIYKNCIGVLTSASIFSILAVASIILVFISLPRILPIKAVKNFVTAISNEFGNFVVLSLKITLHLLHRPNWEVEFPPEISKYNWYLGMSNHMSWSDIFILLFISNGKIPLLKFFMKKELKWIPIVYLIHRTIDMPFVNRHTKEEIQDNPELKKIDFENSRIAAKKFSRYPSTAFSFAEGTRYSDEKHEAQSSPYRNLLIPKIGALATALNGMPEVDTILDFTIIYKSKKRSAWAYACGEMKDVKIVIKSYPIPYILKNKGFDEQAQYQEDFKNFIEDIWRKKEQIIKQSKF